MRQSKVRAMTLNNNGPCPGQACKHHPTDHRPIANTKNHFCYGKGCMNECRPGIRKNDG